jgi:hypothetical protein
MIWFAQAKPPVSLRKRLLYFLEREYRIRCDRLSPCRDSQAKAIGLMRDAGMRHVGHGMWEIGPSTIDWMIAEKATT